MYSSTNVMPCYQKMQVRPFAIFFAMFDDQNTKVLVLQSGPCRRLETLDHFLNLFFGRPVLRRESNHSRRIRIFVFQPVHQVGKKYRVPPPHDHLLIGSFPQQISHRLLSRSPRPHELNVHGFSPP